MSTVHLPQWRWGAAVLGLSLATLGPVTIPAHAEISLMAPQTRERTSVDGWAMTVSLDQESINPVPNLAGAHNSREAFVTLSARATITGTGSYPVTAANFVAGYQVGCQIDVSQGLQLGGTAQLGGSLGASGPPTGLQAGGNGALGGFVQTTMQPGVINTIPMGNMPLVAQVGNLDMQDVHLKVDACGGPVTVRSYASMAIGTDVEQTQLSVYGDPFVLT